VAVSFGELIASPESIDRDAAATFDLLGLAEGPELSVPLIARLLDKDEAATEYRSNDSSICTSSIPSIPGGTACTTCSRRGRPLQPHRPRRRCPPQAPEQPQLELISLRTLGGLGGHSSYS
jgi:hypothetical protein